MKKLVFCLLLLISFAWQAKASHIAGAELTYECLEYRTFAADYRVTLKLYRDCLNANPQATFPDPIDFFIFESTSKTLYLVAPVSAPFSTPKLVPENWSACVGSPYNLCIEEGVYTLDLTLPHLAGGWDVAYSLCCRNGVVTNLDLPGDQGVTFVGHVPGSDVVNSCNSMPQFKQAPSLFLCAGEEYNFDHSAVDPDGDSLVYMITNPYSGVNVNNVGASTNNPQPNISNPVGAPPYQHVNYATGYSYTAPFGLGTISIDPNTGYLSALPLNPGIYVIAISVFEYRNGKLLSENKRDFQFNVINCLPQGNEPVISPDLSNVPSSGDTVFATASNNFCFTFEVSDAVTVGKLVVNPVSTIFGGNGGFPAPYATLNLSGNNPVTGTLCWKPSCEAVGQTYELLISAWDSAACPNYNIALDTIWIVVQAPVGAPPLVEHDLTGLPFSGDTLQIPVQTPFCYSFYITDTNGTGANYTYTDAVLTPNGDSLNKTHTITTHFSNDTLFGELCWKSFCNVGTLYMMTLNGIDKGLCPPDNQSSDTVFIEILEPPTAFPVVSYNLGNLNVNGDTLVVNAFEEFCFDFTVADTSGLADSLQIEAFAEAVGNPNITGGPTTSGQMVGDTLFGQVCWQPSCAHVGSLFRLVVKGQQVHKCLIIREVAETLYVRVNLLNNPPPQISHDLGPTQPLPSELTLVDDEEFCMKFLLEDTVAPAFLQLETQVVRLNGQPYQGPEPEVNFSAEFDSSVAGTLCWSVSCAYANESFMIYLIGRDTFDCNLQNTVLDSILVNHEETLPAEVGQCRVTVLPGDAAIELDWESNLETDVRGYLIRRSAFSGGPFEFVDSVLNVSSMSYMDANADPDAHPWCYEVLAYDRCGNFSPVSEVFCTIHLQAEDVGFESQLDWTPYVGWSNGVASHQIYISELPDLTLYQQLGVVSGQEYGYLHADPESAINCYRIRGLESNPGCGIESWSNEVCVTFPPRLYFPNAFTPNNDGINDEFYLPGLFVETFDLQIFDRWGKLIFESRNPTSGWKGTFKNGQNCPEGVYMYTLNAKGYEGTELHRAGSVTLIR
ncbi:MAG: gliding motility-associated C-terminal domain-containing protein [Bacteroidia bacterium]|nr:gliding motility-associated C-terminal domain-containing protein [Bacteroidia bacterium]